MGDRRLKPLREVVAGHGLNREQGEKGVTKTHGRHFLSWWGRATNYLYRQSRENRGDEGGQLAGGLGVPGAIENDVWLVRDVAAIEGVRKSYGRNGGCYSIPAQQGEFHERMDSETAHYLHGRIIIGVSVNHAELPMEFREYGPHVFEALSRGE